MRFVTVNVAVKAQNALNRTESIGPVLNKKC